MASRETLRVDDDHIDTVLSQLDTFIVGKSHETKLALCSLLANGHLLVEDLPGVGKTTLARALAATLGLAWNRVQFTSDLLPADVTGISIFDVAKQEFRLHQGPVFTSLLLADEINRAPPKTQSALLEAMEEAQVTIDGKRYPLAKPFFVVATQNPLEQLGVYPLPESQLDRFICCIELGYPHSEAERSLLTGDNRQHMLNDVAPAANPDNVLFWQARARQIYTAPPILDYTQALLAATRKFAAKGGCATGLSPRAGLSLLAMSRAWAMLHGRDMVLPEDLQAVFTCVAAHRLAGSLKQGTPIARDILHSVDLV
ncbi:hypothetical protein AB833_15960 [Chromatiales bacterium (ex Bugula neritina AB1)]|nr:hypothetical protein AB833_15960 [Chromatiales bacterium (ex Bugula neritina AB1)]